MLKLFLNDDMQSQNDQAAKLCNDALRPVSNARLLLHTSRLFSSPVQNLNSPLTVSSHIQVTILQKDACKFGESFLPPIHHHLCLSLSIHH